MPQALVSSRDGRILAGQVGYLHRRVMVSLGCAVLTVASLTGCIQPNGPEAAAELSATTAAASAEPPAPQRQTAKSQRPRDNAVRDLEKRIVGLINDERTSRKLPPLRVVDGLMEVARGHSQDMLDRDYFAHSSPEGVSSHERMKKAGLTEYVGSAENVGMIQETPRLDLGRDLAEELVQGWMKSKGHRENILRPAYCCTGVGLAVNRTTVKATQVFGQVRPKTRQ